MPVERHPDLMHLPDKVLVSILNDLTITKHVRQYAFEEIQHRAERTPARIAHDAIAHLMAETGCSFIEVAQHISDMAELGLLDEPTN